MQFAKELREGVRRGFITTSIRIWRHPRVKAGGRYKMDGGDVVVESIEEISEKDITTEMAMESGFASKADLLEVARHGGGERVYMIRFRFVAAVL